MDSTDIMLAARDLAKRLHSELKAGRLSVVGIDHIRSAVAGYMLGHNVGTGSYATPDQAEQIVPLTTRKLVEMV